MQLSYLPRRIVIGGIALMVAACGVQKAAPQQQSMASKAQESPQQWVKGKPVVYQVFTRLFGNQNTTNKPWGTLAENGVGKFNDFNDAALSGIKELGVTHIWYTGVPHHALIGDYKAYGINDDDPDVVKGRAGSPYAVKDYYSVNPDLAENPANRLQEFEALIERTHQHGMQVIIDIVPNHVARNYQSLAKPDGVEDFGASDNTSVEYSRDNNFYYVVDEAFAVPKPEDGYQPLGGEAHPLADGKFSEFPAKWTGNGSRAAQPEFGDWYETVKINYGVRADGSYDFPRLPSDFANKDITAHAEFWADKEVPDSWQKFRDIALYWIAKGVDGFRYDMAEMVPVEFWSYLNSSIKQQNPNAFILAEVYNPELYRDYIHLGRMDYLYDKVGLYDTLKPVMQFKSGTDQLPAIIESVSDIEQHMLHFLENHDEQRIASAEFAGDAELVKPALIVSALQSRAPTMIYFGQEVGEPGAGDAGFGKETRTTIFDYWGVPTHQRWMNGGKFDGGQLSDAEKELRDFYQRVLHISATAPAMQGSYQEIHRYNREHSNRYTDSLFTFVRWNDEQRLIVVSNFSRNAAEFELLVPNNVIKAWSLTDENYALEELLYSKTKPEMTVADGAGRIALNLAPLESLVLELKLAN